ncbi:hypothetical protein CDO52_10080 [Nocardiopsis gilva YIM 90087]|uniref:Uncharacterized protein n=1 Tax=Nocardiopsis gilva YIM 90087 TaxID=1235441 RepID=A0A223S4Y5_9ACTN|nr:hypothetical protein CDO52_10080 [Nocardiopsis gilva YIM 90087]
MTLAGALPALAASALSDPLADRAGQHYAAARIAALEWCGQGVIGDVTTDRAGGDATADWTSDADGVGTEPHFREPPDQAYSAVTRRNDELTAAAGVANLRFTPDCAPFAEPLDADDGDERDVPDLLRDEDLVALDSARTLADWTAQDGARATMEIEGLEILGEPVDLVDGPYRTDFTEERDDGDSIQVEVTAEKHVAELVDELPTATTANAWLAIRLTVAWLDEDGEETASSEYRLELAQAGVHSEGPTGDATGDREPSDGDGDADPSAGTPDASPTGDASGGTPKSGDASEPPVLKGDPTPEPNPQPAPPPEHGASGPTPPASPSATDPSPRTPPSSPSATRPSPTPSSPRPTSTVAQPVLPAPTPPRQPGRSNHPGYLPITGSALVSLIGSGLVAIGGGSAAIYLGRSRKAGIDGDDI